MERLQQLWRALPRLFMTKLTVLFVAFLACSIGFVALADEVQDGDTLRFDELVLRSINSGSNGFWDMFFSIVTQFGGVIGVLVIAGGIFALLLYRRKYRKSVLLAAGVGGAALINAILKLIFERARPDLWEQLVVETSFSFPSGHAMASSALALSLIAILWRTKYRWVAMIAGVLFTLLIGLSRLYLGVHYPTDVMAGWLVSVAWVMVVTVALHQKAFLGQVFRTKDS